VEPPRETERERADDDGIDDLILDDRPAAPRYAMTPTTRIRIRMPSSASLPYEREREKYAGVNDAGVTRPRHGAGTTALMLSNYLIIVATPHGTDTFAAVEIRFGEEVREAA